MPAYVVIEPTAVFKNHNYAYWVEAWTRWFYQTNPDQNNNGDVVFCRSMPFLPDAGYNGDGVVMVGADSLDIFEDQAVLLPVITANYVADHGEPIQWLYEMVRTHILGGDRHPLKIQVRIDRGALDDGTSVDDLAAYEVETGVFLVDIPDSSYGQSLKDVVETPMQSSGLFPSVTRGYYVLVKFSEGEHDIQTYARGMPTSKGIYQTGMLYHIRVRHRYPPVPSSQPNIPYKPISKILASLTRKAFSGGIGEE